MGGRKKTLQELIEEEARGLMRELDHWCYMMEHGCNDPHWPDGCNMNLTRNHIIYGKRRLEQLCSEAGVDCPEEYYLPVPPEVSDWYMADMNGSRAEKLMQMHFKLTGTKQKKCPEQGALF